MRKIGIVGHFGGNESFFDGQTVKTKNLYRALEEEFPSEHIKKIDTYGYKKNIFSFFFKTVGLIFSSKNVIMLPDENGVKVFVPLYCLLNIFLRRGLHYVVIGGWLPVFLKKRKCLSWFAKRLTGIYVETSSMKKALEDMGFDNISIVPNFKYLNVLKESELEYDLTLPHRLCIFSRIMPQKGVEEAIAAVSDINHNCGKTVYELDIYGPVDREYELSFKELCVAFPNYIRYMGTVPYGESVNTIKQYFALLFPTKFYTEGVPGTLIDAYAAGVPVITSLWGNYEDVFDDNITGWGFEFGDFERFYGLLEKAAEDPETFLKMKVTALKKVDDFLPSKLIKTLTQRMI